VRKEKNSWERLRDSRNSIVRKEKNSWERRRDSRNSIVRKEKKSWERLRDSRNSIVRKEKNSWERLHDSWNSIVRKEKNSWERLRDSRNSIVKKEKKNREKGFVIARIPLWKRKSSRKRPRDSLSSTVKKEAWDNNKLWPRKIPSMKGFPPKRPETTTSCGLKKIPSTKGFQPKRPETAVSCGLKSHPRGDSHQKSLHNDFEKVNAQGVAYRFLFSIDCWKVFQDNIIVRKGQGARAENCRKSGLKQLRVAVSSEASLPVGSSPQISKTNFVDLRNDGRSFPKLTKISPKICSKFANSKLREPAFKFSCKTARWGRVTFFQEKKKRIYCLVRIKTSE
jgi:hypothetical protein